MSELTTDTVTKGISALIASVGPASRRAMAQEIARMLRDQTSKNILKNVEPDGAAMLAKKRQKKRKKENKMFKKLGQRSALNLVTSPNSAQLKFKSKHEKIANIHHFGLESIVNKKGLKHRFAERILMSITNEQKSEIKDILLKHLSTK